MQCQIYNVLSGDYILKISAFFQIFFQLNVDLIVDMKKHRLSPLLLPNTPDSKRDIPKIITNSNFLIVEACSRNIGFRREDSGFIQIKNAISRASVRH
jgi:hypothetical protein